MLKKYPYILLTGSLFILGLSIGFFASRTFTTATNTLQTNAPANRNGNNIDSNGDNLYASQIASLRGEITESDKRLITIKNLNNNAIGTREVSDRILIGKIGNKTPSSDLSSIELNKEALITLEKSDGVYKVTQIQYILPAPSLPPITATPDPSSTPKITATPTP